MRRMPSNYNSFFHHRYRLHGGNSSAIDGSWNSSLILLQGGDSSAICAAEAVCVRACRQITQGMTASGAGHEYRSARDYSALSQALPSLHPWGEGREHLHGFELSTLECIQITWVEIE
jgi:hypothetical protein